MAVSAGLLVAAIVGVQLGQSAISEINPIHFRGPQERPVGIDPAALRPAAATTDPNAQEWVWSPVPVRSADCGGDCDARQIRDAAALAYAEPARGLSAPYWRDVTPTTELAPWRPGDLPNRGLSVERYLHYPVTGEEAAEAAAPPPPAAAAPLPAGEPLIGE